MNEAKIRRIGNNRYYIEKTTYVDDVRFLRVYKIGSEKAKRAHVSKLTINNRRSESTIVSDRYVKHGKTPVGRDYESAITIERFIWGDNKDLVVSQRTVVSPLEGEAGFTRKQSKKTRTYSDGRKFSRKQQGNLKILKGVQK